MINALQQSLIGYHGTGSRRAERCQPASRRGAPSLRVDVLTDIIES
jgi:hypothetical protein